MTVLEFKPAPKNTTLQDYADVLHTMYLTPNYGLLPFGGCCYGARTANSGQITGDALHPILVEGEKIASEYIERLLATVNYRYLPDDKSFTISHTGDGEGFILTFNVKDTFTLEVTIRESTMALSDWEPMKLRASRNGLATSFPRMSLSHSSRPHWTIMNRLIDEFIVLAATGSGLYTPKYKKLGLTVFREYGEGSLCLEFQLLIDDTYN